MNEHPMNKFLRNFGPKIGVKSFNSSDIDYILEHNITNKRMHIELKYNNSPYNELTDLQYKIYLQQHKLNKNDPNFISSYLFKRDPFLKKNRHYRDWRK